jgi:hypothetical protein
VWNIHLRETSTEEINDFHWLLDNDPELGYGVRMILLRDEGYTVPEIRKKLRIIMTITLEWIHRFNEKGIDGLYLEKIYQMFTRLQRI